MTNPEPPVIFDEHIWVGRTDHDFLSCEATCWDNLPRPAYAITEDIVDYWEETQNDGRKTS